MKPEVSAFFHAATGTYAYVVADPATGRAAVIDPVLDFDLRTGATGTLFADALIAHAHEKKLAVDYILETHAHADHLSSGTYLAQALGARLGIGARIVEVQRAFNALYGLADAQAADGSDFDLLLVDGATLALGELAIDVLATPGHTADGVSYRIGDAVFVGDTLFAPDVGTARCDFPGGDAATLFRSIQRILALPTSTLIFLCHDYPPPGRAPAAETTIGAERQKNIHLVGRDEGEFALLRRTRDNTLAQPQLMWAALQVNIRGGRLPPPESNGRSYLKLPLNVALSESTPR
jgi:glyoxylase-like metal-dependent hydrolase (beta-lactamase superfamily II)